MHGSLDVQTEIGNENEHGGEACEEAYRSKKKLNGFFFRAVEVKHRRLEQEDISHDRCGKDEQREHHYGRQNGGQFGIWCTRIHENIDNENDDDDVARSGKRVHIRVARHATMIHKWIAECQARQIVVLCGEGEIRTPDTLRYAGFRNRCIRPLCHLSIGEPSGSPLRTAALQLFGEQRMLLSGICQKQTPQNDQANAQNSTLSGTEKMR